MSRSILGLTLITALSFAGTPTAAQEAKPLAQSAPAAKVYDVPKDGLVIAGKLSKDDPPLAGALVAELNGAPHQVFQVKLQKGQSYVIDLVSKDFDAYLILQNAIGKVLAHDDDGGGGTNSRIVAVAKTEGTHRLVVVALDRKVGAFQLKLRLGKLTAEDEREQMFAEAKRLTDEALRLYHGAKFQDALKRVEEALARWRELFPADMHPEGQPFYAQALQIVGMVQKEQGAYDKAAVNLKAALAMYRRLHPLSQHPDGHDNIIGGLNTLANLMFTQRAYAAALPLHEEALAMARRLYPASKYPEGHERVAEGFVNLAASCHGLGDLARAKTHLQEAVAVERRLYPKSKFPDGHRELAGTLNNLGILLRSDGEYAAALPVLEETVAMRRRLYSATTFPGGHPHLATSLDNLGLLHSDLGAFDRALALHEEALAVQRKLYPVLRFPQGHPALARTLFNLATSLESAKLHGKSQERHEEALTMRRKFYTAAQFPNGHPDVSASLNELGRTLGVRGEHAKALALLEEALVIDRKLYPTLRFPDGHPLLAKSLNGACYVHKNMGRWDDARRLCEETVTMLRRLYPAKRFPDGHPSLLASLNNLAFIHGAREAWADAAPLFDEALAMMRKLDGRLLVNLSEAEGLQLAHSESRPLTCDAFLTASRRLPDSDAAAYRSVWETKAKVMRVLELRRAITRGADGETRGVLEHFKEVRGQIDRVVQDSRLTPAERGTLLAPLAAERDRLERDLARRLPALEDWKLRGRLAPSDLAAALPVSTAFVDIYQYSQFDFKVPARATGGPAGRVLHYVAFVSAHETPARRVELGPAEPIDAAIRGWRTAIEQRQPEGLAGTLRQLLWSPIAAALPLRTRALYLSPDEDLARLPWAALPVNGERVLLEEFAIAVVPHGPWLLDALRRKSAPEGLGRVVTVGGLDYGAKSDWPELRGTAVEVAAVAALAPMAITLTKDEATAERLKRELPTARYVHLATHGQFKADELAGERRRQEAARQNWTEGAAATARPGAAQNPLAFVGLVLAKSEIMSGLSILDLDLEHTRLITLSACETGLGEYTGGKGVENLQLAFHVAGAENVVASLWKVNDAATAALMAKFYHEMWVNKKPPIEALREAQLTIYRHPELIPDLAGERGTPRLKEAVAVRAGAPATGTGKHTETKLWAAFVLSGVGR